jgi:hypothetical protein
VTRLALPGPNGRGARAWPSAPAVIRLTRELDLDVVVMVLKMFEDGHTVGRQLKTQLPTLRIPFITALPELYRSDATSNEARIIDGLRVSKSSR